MIDPAALSPRIRSGAMYDWQPMFVLARLATRFPETPKSHSFTEPEVLTRMLVGLTSRVLESGGRRGQ
jgi:hypothetical protein